MPTADIQMDEWKDTSFRGQPVQAGKDIQNAYGGYACREKDIERNLNVTVEYKPYKGRWYRVSEIDIFNMYIQQIAELIAVCREMNQKEYEGWKIETMKTTLIEAVVFMKKIFAVVDRCVYKKIKTGA